MSSKDEVEGHGDALTNSRRTRGSNGEPRRRARECRTHPVSLVAPQAIPDNLRGLRGRRNETQVADAYHRSRAREAWALVYRRLRMAAFVAGN
jgi:hypothetical protein